MGEEEVEVYVEREVEIEVPVEKEIDIEEEFEPEPGSLEYNQLITSDSHTITAGGATIVHGYLYEDEIKKFGYSQLKQYLKKIEKISHFRCPSSGTKGALIKAYRKFLNEQANIEAGTTTTDNITAGNTSKLGEYETSDCSTKAIGNEIVWKFNNTCVSKNEKKDQK